MPGSILHDLRIAARGLRRAPGFRIEGRPAPADGDPVASFRAVTPGYFEALEIPLRRGRDFGTADAGEAPGAVIINEPMARRYFPDEDPIGRRLQIDIGLAEPFSAGIVGVAGGVRHVALEWEPFDEMYVPHAQVPRPAMTVVARTRMDPDAAAPAVREAVGRIDRNQPLSEFVTMETLVDRAAAQPRFRTLLLALFAAIATLLAVLGLYGVMSYLVAQRTHEIGIRMALGASPADVLRLVVRQGMGLALAGLAIGVPAAAGLARFMSGVLFGVGAVDPVAFLGAAVLLAAAAGLACYLPARRAAGFDPNVALRYE